MMKYLTVRKAIAAWNDIQPLSDRDRERLSRKFTVEFNFNSNHIEGNTLSYGQTELLLLFGKVVGEAEMKDLEEMKASNVGLKMIQEQARLKEMPLTQNFVRQLHKTLLREDYTVYRELPGGQQTSYVIHAGCYKTRPNSVITRYGDILWQTLWTGTMRKRKKGNYPLLNLLHCFTIVISGFTPSRTETGE